MLSEIRAKLSRLIKAIFRSSHDERILEIFTLHIGNSMQCGKALKTLCEKPNNELIEYIIQLESAGDNLVREMHTLIDSVFITHISKEDIVRLITHLDHIIDAMEGVAQYMRTYAISVPRSEAHSFAEIICTMLKEVERLVIEMPLWNKKSTSELARAISAQEEEADQILRTALKNLEIEVAAAGQASEVETALSEVKEAMNQRFVWTAIFEKLERVTDSCEDVADAVSSIVRKKAS